MILEKGHSVTGTVTYISGFSKTASHIRLSILILFLLVAQLAGKVAIEYTDCVSVER